MSDTPEVTQLRHTLNELWEKKIHTEFLLAQAVRKRNEEICGVKCGDIVEVRGKKFQVACFDDTFYGWLDGYEQKKDGTFGNRLRHLYNDWKKL